MEKMNKKLKKKMSTNRARIYLCAAKNNV